jgi:hypothetical protein
MLPRRQREFRQHTTHNTQHTRTGTGTGTAHDEHEYAFKCEER